MRDDTGGLLGTLAFAGLAVICCAGPFLVVALASLSIGTWLAAHGLWLLGGLGLLVAAAAVVAYRRRQSGAACDGEEHEVEVSRPTSASSGRGSDSR